MSQNIKTAIVAAAGQGTRVWPATKAVFKELFPLGRIPVLLHIVLEILEAGIKNVVVVACRRNRRQIELLFDQSDPVPVRMAGDSLAERIRRSMDRSQISVIEQVGRYGNGSPLLAAAAYVDAAPFLYAFGDDVVIGENAAARIGDVFRSTASPVMGVQEVRRERVSSFGIVECSAEGDNEYVTRLLEKPSPSESNQILHRTAAISSRHPLLIVLKVRPGRDGELWLTDAIARYLGAGRAYVSRLRTGAWHTVGDPSSYAEAVMAASKEQQTVGHQESGLLPTGALQ